MYPAAGSEIFRKLRRGDEVKISAGRGSPQTKTEVKEVIVEVSGFSALTNRGRKLGCMDGVGLSMTGAWFGKFSVSWRVYWIRASLWIRNALQPVKDFFESISLRFSLWRWEMRRKLFPPNTRRSRVFGTLRSGDEIKIQAGRGDPKTTEEVTEVIAEISGSSAVTNTGRKLMCTDASGIVATGNRPEYEISLEAQVLINRTEG